MRTADPKPSLGDAEVVAGLVRAFLAVVVDRVAEVGAEREDQGVAAMADQHACLAMADIFLRRDPASEPPGEWNDGTGLVDWCYEQLRHYYRRPEANPGDRGRRVCSRALAVYEAVCRGALGKGGAG